MPVSEMTEEEIARLEMLAATGTDDDRAQVAADLAGSATQETAPPPRRRGRPKGSRNKPKEDTIAAGTPGAGERASGPGVPAARQTRGAKVGREVGQQIASVGLMVTLFGDEHCGLILAKGGPQLGDAYGKLADKNPTVLAIMESMVNGGVYAEVIVVTLAIVLPILAHHGLAPAGAAALFATAPHAHGPEGNPPTNPAPAAAPAGFAVPTGPPAQNGY